MHFLKLFLTILYFNQYGKVIQFSINYLLTSMDMLQMSFNVSEELHTELSGHPTSISADKFMIDIQQAT